MANIILNTDVFNFLDTRADVITERGAEVTKIITREQAALEAYLGRSVISNTLTDFVFDPGKGDCHVSPKDSSVLFLDGVYRDLYSVSAISEAGDDLDAVTSYLDGNDYFLDADRGILKRMNATWGIYYFSIVVSGKYGFVNQSDDSARDDVKQLLIEIVAVKSGLWKEWRSTPDSRIEVIRNKLDDSILSRRASLRNRSL